MSSCKSDQRCIHGVAFDQTCPYCSYEHAPEYTEKTTMAAPDKNPDSTDSVIADIPEIMLEDVHTMNLGVREEIDMVNHPPHYTQHPSGIECIQITEHMGFNLGSALKYIWRADLKFDALEDMRKAIWYIEREITKREKNDRNEDAAHSCGDRVTALDN